MISVFPEFSSLSLEHQADVESCISQFAPYSDFDFTSLYCWDIDESVGLSILNGNLIIKIPDYLTGNPIVSLLGDQQIDETLDELTSTFPQLGLVPEVVIDKAQSLDAFTVEDDRDAYDYIYCVKDMASLARPEFKLKRKRYRRFQRDFENTTLEDVRLASVETRDAIQYVFAAWAVERQKDDADVANERRALNRLLDNAAMFPRVQVVLMRVDNELTGFSINELLPNGYAICHFHKTLLNYENIDVYLSSRIAQSLDEQGCEYLNWEQDLGIDGLRSLKMSYLPLRFLRKYSLTRTS